MPCNIIKAGRKVLKIVFLGTLREIVLKLLRNWERYFLECAINGKLEICSKN